MELTHEQRKKLPIYSGVLRYFPLALLEVSKVSQAGNDQHHKGEPLWWDKSKSTDEADALVRHLLESGTNDTDGIRHTAKVAWRALALLERELENDTKKENIKIAITNSLTKENMTKITLEHEGTKVMIETEVVKAIDMVELLFKPIMLAVQYHPDTVNEVLNLGEN